MKIGIDARMYGSGQTGIGNYIKHVTDNILKIDNENEYVLFLREPEFSKFTPPNKRVRKVKAEARWYSWREQVILPWQMLKENVDLMHFPHFNSPILYPKKSVVTIHDVTPRFFPGHKMKSIVRRLGFRAVFNSSVHKAAHVIAVSGHTKRDVMRYFHVPDEKITVTYLGVEPYFRKIENYAKIKEIKDRFSITGPFIFYVGVWRNHKNVDGLIKAFGIFLKKYKMDYQLVIGGQEDPYYPEVRKAWEDLGIGGRVIRPGFIKDDDLPLFYNAAELYVVPSFYEGFGLNGLEAMACGTPVASSKVTSLPEVYEDSAVYFDPNDHEEMADAMAAVLMNKEKKEELTAKGYQRVKRYRWENCARATLEIYKKSMK